jgi:hypothetical protein
MSRRATLPGASELFRATGPARVSEVFEAPEGTSGPESGDHEMSTDLPPAATLAETGVRPTEAAPDRAQEQARVGTVARTASVGPAKRKLASSELAPEERRSSGRQKHDEKITVYVSADELVELERARLTLRAEHGLAVDRGRIVREAVAILLADLESTGQESALIRRLRGA